MRRTSVIGPLLLILLGGLLLVSNLSDSLNFVDILAMNWPWILIGWGMLRLAELFLWSRREEPLFPQGIRSGEWFLVFLICLVGSGLYGGRDIVGNFPLRVDGVRLFGEAHDFGLDEQRLPAAGVKRLLVENLRGEVIIAGEEIEEVRVSGRESVRALNEEDARTVWEARKLTMEQQGDLIIVRTNQESSPSERRLSSYLQVRVPKGMAIETRGRNTDYEVTQLDANVDINADNGDARITSVKGEVRVRLNESDNIQVRDVEGLVEVASSRGDDLELENIRGPSTISGSFSGNMLLRSLSQPVRVEDRRLDLRAEAIPGEVVADRGNFLGKGITGPTRIASESKDIELLSFTNALELNLERGDADIRNAESAVQPMQVDVRRGKVTLALPPQGIFDLQGEARKGEIENNTDLGLTVESDASGSRIKGGRAGAPKIVIRAERIEIESQHGSRGDSERE